MYRWIERESEVELLIEDDSPEAVLTEGLVALGELLQTQEGGGTPVTHEIDVSAPDLPALLTAWLGELVFLAENDGFIPERVVHLKLAGSTLQATVGGLRSSPHSLVKAVTCHRLEVEEEEGAWHAHVVMNV